MPAGVASEAYTLLCSFLTTEIGSLAGLEATVSAVDPEDPSVYLMDMRGFLQELGCVYTSLLLPDAMDSAENKLRLLEFLATELAACRINTVNGTGPGSSAMMAVDDSGADSGDAKLMTEGIVRVLSP